MQASLAAMGAATPGELYVPFQVEQIQLYGAPCSPCWCHARLRPTESNRDGAIAADLSFMDEDGRVLGRGEGLVLRRTDRAGLLRERTGAAPDWWYEPRWKWLARPAAETSPTLRTGGNGRL